MKALYSSCLLIFTFLTDIKSSHSQDLRAVINESISFIENQTTPPLLKVLSVSISITDTNSTDIFSSGYGIYTASFRVSPDSNYANPALERPLARPLIKAPYFGSGGRLIQSVGNCNDANTYYRCMLYKTTRGIIGRVITFTSSRNNRNNSFTTQSYKLDNNLNISMFENRHVVINPSAKIYIIQGFINDENGNKMFLMMKISQEFLRIEG